MARRPRLAANPRLERPKKMPLSRNSLDLTRDNLDRDLVATCVASLARLAGLGCSAFALDRPAQIARDYGIPQRK